MQAMPNQDGTEPAVKGSGRKLGTCGVRKSGGSCGANADAAGLGKSGKRTGGCKRTAGVGNPTSSDKGDKRKFEKTNEFSNPEWWK
jgi:hypothetical protein